MTCTLPDLICSELQFRKMVRAWMECAGEDGGGSYTDEEAQDAVGAMVDSTLVYTDATPLLSRAALTGDITASAGANATTLKTNLRRAALTIVLDGGGAAITTGVKRDMIVPYDCTVRSCTMVGTPAGAIVVDLWKSSYANFDNGATHPLVGDSMVASAKPTITATNYKSQDNTVTGWGTIAAGDIIRPNVDSCSSIQAVTIVLEVEKT